MHTTILLYHYIGLNYDFSKEKTHVNTFSILN